MLKVLPKRAGGEFIVEMNLKSRYLKDNDNGPSREK
jgi:hypothetical protein